MTWSIVESIRESTVGIGYSSLGVARFRFLKFMQILSFLFFLRIGTMLDNHFTYLIILMNLVFNKCFIFFLMAGTTSEAKRLKACLKGRKPTLVGSLCSTIVLSNPGIFSYSHAKQSLKLLSKEMKTACTSGAKY